MRCTDYRLLYGLCYNVELRAYPKGTTDILAKGMAFTLAWCAAMTLSLTDLMTINERGVNYIPLQ